MKQLLISVAEDRVAMRRPGPPRTNSPAVEGQAVQCNCSWNLAGSGNCAKISSNFAKLFRLLVLNCLNTEGVSLNFANYVRIQSNVTAVTDPFCLDVVLSLGPGASPDSRTKIPREIHGGHTKNSAVYQRCVKITFRSHDTYMWSEVCHH
jgi:hypothetical protein